MRKFERKQNRTEAQKARDERTHFLIQLGAELDTALHHYFPDYVTGDPDTLEIFKMLLYINDRSNQPFFPSYWSEVSSRIDK